MEIGVYIHIGHQPSRPRRAAKKRSRQIRPEKENFIEAHTAGKPDDIERPTSTTAALVAALKLSAAENMHINPSARRSTAARSRTRGPGGFNTKYYVEPLRRVRGEQHGLASCARSRLSLRSSIGQICTLATRPRPRA